MDLLSQLESFYSTYNFGSKGPLCVALVVTDHAKKSGLPLNADALVTDGGGQVLGLGRSSVQSILARHDITKVLASEGGRTSRGSMGNMRSYVDFLNSISNVGQPDLELVESYWIEKVKLFFSAKPFMLSVDNSLSVKRIVSTILSQAEERQKAGEGTMYVGIVMQHLVGAKLDCLLGNGSIEHHGASTSDAQTNRQGDFFIGDSAIHVTTAPAEALIERCKSNLRASNKPVIITLRKSVPVAEGLAANEGIVDRVDIWDIEQFIATNIYEFGKFQDHGRSVAVADIFNRYNELVDSYETDPSLKVSLSER